MSSLSQTVGAVVVNYNAGDALLDCVSSIFDAGVGDVVVVDNASTDGSIDRLSEKLPQAKILRQDNVGFGRGVNAGAALLTQPYILSLNPDARLHNGALATLVADLDEHPNVGIVGPHVVSEGGEHYPSARAFPHVADGVGHALVGLITKNNPWTRRYTRSDSAQDRRQTVDWLSGSAMLIRRTAFEKVGGFCPDYFMYFEDVDLCWQMKAQGFACVFNPGATVTHIGGVSTRQAPMRMSIAHHRSALRFSSRTLRGAARAWLPIITLGLFARIGIASLKRKFGRNT